MIPFPSSTLRAAAQAALKGLATRYLRVILFKCWSLVEFMDCDARSLLGICCDLLSELSKRNIEGQDQDHIERQVQGNIERLDKHKIIESYADSVLDVLSKDQLLMLSLVTWRFDGSLHDLSARRLPPPDLLQHLSTSAIDDVCEDIVANYSRYSGQTTSLKVLTTKFRMLVYLVLNDFLSHFSEPLCTEDMISFLLYHIHGDQRAW
ncbi:hypothetical protein V6Z93_002359 [Aspergillus fumigatus]